MPELPEVETTLRGVAPYLLGHRVIAVTVRERRLRWPVPEAVDHLAGATIETARRRAKYLLFGTAAGTLLIHLGMSGGLRIVDPATAWRKHDHVGLLMDTGKQLRFHDPRRFGCILLADAATPEQHPLLADLGPEPLEAEFTAEHLFALSRAKSAAVKTFIMDASVVVGVGNIYANEALFMAGIRPTRPAGKVTRAEFARLVEAIQRVLAASIESGGTTLRDFLREDGAPGYFKQSLRVYDRQGQGCVRCTGVVKRSVLGQRATYFCPQCQR
jgi:formamidopyrimidine-DNA glycosylase